MNNSTDVYTILLDGSRAFDRVNYVKLFKLFIKRHLCPTVARFLANIYTSQCIRVKWGNFISNDVPVTNGVKQGGVLSPILFIIYMDERLRTLSLSGVSCYVGNMYCRSLGYAVDVILLAAGLYSVKKLLCICEAFTKDYDVTFNSQKSKLLVCRCSSNKHINDHLNIDFMDGRIVQSLNEKHLGNILGPKCNSNIITETVNVFVSKLTWFYLIYACSFTYRIHIIQVLLHVSVW